MSYHNGSVWPHDNALIAKGLARYGMMDSALKILAGLLDASIFLDLHRLPELFCGFDRRPGEGPTLYPVACSPQSWASAAVYLILESCLGISIQGMPPVVMFRRTRLPESLPMVQVNNLQVGDASVSFIIKNAGDGVDVGVLRKEGAVSVVSVK
jgi:glycogen debranching enzyme